MFDEEKNVKVNRRKTVNNKEGRQKTDLDIGGCPMFETHVLITELACRRCFNKIMPPFNIIRSSPDNDKFLCVFLLMMM